MTAATMLTVFALLLGVLSLLLMLSPRTKLVGYVGIDFAILLLVLIHVPTGILLGIFDSVLNLIVIGGMLLLASIFLVNISNLEKNRMKAFVFYLLVIFSFLYMLHTQRVLHLVVTIYWCYRLLKTMEGKKTYKFIYLVDFLAILAICPF